MHCINKICLAICLLVLGSSTFAQDSAQKKKDDWARLQHYYDSILHNDWSYLSKYRDANTALGAPAKGEKRVVFMGNSITEGWMNIDSNFFIENKYINRGIGGQTTPQMLVRFRADVVNLQPKVVVMLDGTNDIAGNTGHSTLEMIEDNIASMTELAKVHHIQVVLCAVLPVYDYPWQPGLQPAEKIVKLNAWIKQYAADNDCMYVDYWTPLADERKGMKAAYAKDGVHPTLEGYKVMEPLVKAAITKALTK